MTQATDQDVTSPPAPAAPEPTGASAPAAPDPASAGLRKERTRPPRRQGAGTAWLLALACVAVAAIPLMLHLGSPPPSHPREAQTVATSAETWQRLGDVGLDGWSLGAITPRLNGESQLVGPPGATWVHLLAFELAGIDHAAGPAGVSEMVRVGRLTSAVAMLVLIGAVFWCAHSIGGVQPAFYAAAVTAAMPTLIYVGRLATPDALRIALIMLAMGGALWAIRPLKPAAAIWRQALGWLICGLTLGVATLTTGPIALAWVGYPVLLILLLCPHRISHGLGLLAAAILALLFVAPWAMHVHEQYPQVWSVWSQRLVPGATGDAGGWWDLTRASAAVLLVAAMPWSLWIIAALVQPFSTSSAGSRGRMFLGWGWFLVVALLVLLTPDAEVLPAVLPVLPVIAVLLGQLFRQYADLSAEGRHARFWRALRWPQLGLFFAVSVAGPLVLATQTDLVREGFLPGPLAATMHPAYWAAVGAVLVGIVFFSLRFAVRQYPGWALGAWALWMVLAVTALVVPVTRGDLLRPAEIAEARRLAQAVGDDPVYTLDAEPDALVLLHLGRPAPSVVRDQLAAMRTAGQSLTVLAPLQGAGEPGYVPVDDLPALGLMLWRLPPAEPTPPATMPAAP